MMDRTIPENNRVLLGLSGGVDSTAAALLLREKGFEVTGLFFDVLGDQQAEREAAERTAKELKIPFLYRNVKDQFRDQVISYFCRSYLSGETPNPCVLCNPTVKFRVMREAADETGAYYLATGHYARVGYSREEDRWFIRRGASLKKDQSYMLYRLDQSILSRLLLPLGDTEEKETTRRLVRENGIHNADKKDSQEICFIREGSYVDYIEKQGAVSPPGDFASLQGQILGRHQGLLHYTVGQRKGLGITFGKPTFVVGLDPLKNQVILGDNEDLFKTTVFAKDIRLNCYEDGTGPLPDAWEGKKVYAKIRYAAQPSEAALYRDGGDGVRVEFAQPQRAPTPGQSLVFYDGDRLLGGGFITAKKENPSTAHRE